jgi:hypothetical protein
MKPRGKFVAHCWNPDGTPDWAMCFRNGITQGGLDYLGQVGWVNGILQTPWFLGLIDKLAFASLSPNDTMLSHVGWQEFVGYSQANRPQWVNQEANQSVLTSSVATFTITTAGTLKGLFLTSDNTIGGTAGILWATGLPALEHFVTVGQIVTVGYSLDLAGG